VRPRANVTHERNDHDERGLASFHTKAKPSIICGGVSQRTDRPHLDAAYGNTAYAPPNVSKRPL